MGSIVQSIANCSCCQNKSKYPKPYQFTFQKGQPVVKNKDLFQTNQIRTSKYTLLTFLPKALLLQFKRLANVYFLVVAILLSITIISPINPLTAWSPLIIVIGLSMIRQGYEDYQRYKSDHKNNFQQKTQVYKNGKFQVVEWSKVIVGDVCLVQNQQMFPADLILLYSSNQGNVAHIQTASLDGEKNLKPKNAYPQTAIYNDQLKLSKLNGKFSGQTPNKSLHEINITLQLSQDNPINISGNKQFLYRGTRLKNTKKIYGLVAYTGKNTKIILNSESSSQKMSQIQVKVNYILGVILIIQIVLCIICAMLYGINRNSHQQKYSKISKLQEYCQWPDLQIWSDSILVFLTYFVLLNTMIPISLIVSMEMVKMSQKYFIQKDKLMYSQFRKLYVNVKSASLNEQLGQIEYVFTDKTGTLTKNIMQFKIAVIGTNLYGDLSLVDSSIKPIKDQKGFVDDELKEMLRKGSNDNNLLQQIVIRNAQGTDQIIFKRKRDIAQQYFILLGLTHQVVADFNKQGRKIYQGPSPDQIALVQAAQQMDYQFIRSNQTQTFIKIRGVERKFQLLKSFPFTSDRKRMSIIVRDYRDNRIKMYTKGADSIIKARLSKLQKNNLDRLLHIFSVIGLRTLLVGMRLISEQQYRAFCKKIQQIPQSVRDKQTQKLIDELQNNFYLIGATAVLDRLQDDVPQTIRDLIRANIKVWMLTGDKMQTAENIAKSCKLIQPGFNIIKFQLPNKLSFSDQIGVSRLNNRVTENQIQSALNKLNEQAQAYPNNALLIEGSDLTHILGNQQCKKALAQLSLRCRAVICCRLLPIQKAQLISVVRKYLNKITLAIGDGANDVPMIKTAHIGIGLFGQQGMGAVQASDYALPEFRMLWRLLFIHGRWNYIRISQMILYFFYKNMLFTLPQFIAAFFNGFSGQTIFSDIYITLYNLFFTAIPLLIRAILEQDVNYVIPTNSDSYDYSLSSRNILTKKYLPKQYGESKNLYKLFPKIYFIGQESCIFNYQNFILWILEGSIEATLISLFCFFILGEPSINQNGRNSNYWLTGITIYSSVIIVVTFKLSTHTRFWSLCYILCILILSLGLYAGYMWLSNYFLQPLHFLGVAEVAWMTGDIYFIIIFCTSAILFLDGIIVFMDFKNGSYASKMRELVNSQNVNNDEYYQQLSLYITQGLTDINK